MPAAKKTTGRSRTTKSAPLRFSGALERSDNKLWGCHVRVPAAAAAAVQKSGSRRVVCTLDGTEKFQCAMLFFKTGVPVISVNTTIRKKLGKSFGDAVTVTIEADDSTYGLPVPKELTEVFRQDPEGKKLFHALTPGKQRTLLYIAGKGKDPDRRVTESLVILRHLKENNGAINYRRLSVMLKEAAAHR